MAGKNRPLCKGVPVRPQQQGREQNGHEHQPDARRHENFENAEPADPDQGQADERMDNAPDDLGRGRIADWEQAGARHAAGSDQRAAHGEAPDQKVDDEDPLHPGAEPVDPAFQHGGSGGHLPAGDALVQGPFEQRADHGRPREANADLRAGQAGRQQVSRADAGGGHENAWKYESGSETHGES